MARPAQIYRSIIADNAQQFSHPTSPRLAAAWATARRTAHMLPAAQTRRRPAVFMWVKSTSTKRRSDPLPARDAIIFCNFSRTKRILERAKGFEPSTPTLARSCSTPELHPHPKSGRANGRPGHRAPMPKGRNLCNHPARPLHRRAVPLVARSPALHEARGLACRGGMRCAASGRSLPSPTSNRI